MGMAQRRPIESDIILQYITPYPVRTRIHIYLNIPSKFPAVILKYTHRDHF